jgi:hypothetical protein
VQRLRQDERGAVAIIVCVAMIGLIGMAGLVLDTAALFQERRELQNGADAAALAAAEECARQDAGIDATPLVNECTDAFAFSTAEDYVEDNALDGVSGVDPADVDLDLTNRKVSVSTATELTDGTNEITYRFAQLLSDNFGKTVHADAVASWGAPGTIAALPMTIAECEWSAVAADVLTTLTFHAGSNHDTTCDHNGSDYPGGFGYLDGASECSVTVSVGTNIPGDNGTSGIDGCLANELRAIYDAGEPVGIPIYTSVSGTGANATYTISGFAAFEIVAYDLNHGPAWRYPAVLNPCLPGEVCLVGRFTGEVFSTGTIDPDASDYRTYVVTLTE